MTIPLALAVGLLGWSVLGNLVLGDALYVTRGVVLVAVLLWAGRRAGASWAALGLGGEALRPGLRWGALAVLVVAAAVTLGTLLADHLSGVGLLLTDERADLPGAALAYNALWRVPVGTAVVEELAFRGVLLGLLLQAASPLRAVVVSSLAFGLWHVAATTVTLRINDVAVGSLQGLGTVAGAVAVTTVAGAAFCALRLVSGGLLAPVLAHWATNALGLLAAATRTG